MLAFARISPSSITLALVHIDTRWQVRPQNYRISLITDLSRFSFVVRTVYARPEQLDIVRLRLAWKQRDVQWNFPMRLSHQCTSERKVPRNPHTHTQVVWLFRCETVRPFGTRHIFLSRFRRYLLQMVLALSLVISRKVWQTSQVSDSLSRVASVIKSVRDQERRHVRDTASRGKRGQTRSSGSWISVEVSFAKGWGTCAR